MNLKIKALISTLKIVLIGIAFYAIGFEIGKQFTLDQISVGISCASILFLLYSIFSIKLNQLKYEEQLNKTINTLKD